MWARGVSSAVAMLCSLASMHPPLWSIVAALLLPRGQVSFNVRADPCFAYAPLPPSPDLHGVWSEALITPSSAAARSPTLVSVLRPMCARIACASRACGCDKGEGHLWVWRCRAPCSSPVHIIHIIAYTQGGCWRHVVVRRDVKWFRV